MIATGFFNMYDELKRAAMHDCALEIYRSPLGAVETQSEVVIKLRVMQSGINGAFIVIYGEGWQKTYEMHRDNGYYIIHITTPKNPEVLWYHFCIVTDERNYFYGAKHDKSISVGDIFFDNPPSFQLTVYKKGFQTPDWFKKSIMYQIFPDRFNCHDEETAKQGIGYHESMGRKMVYHENWNEEIKYAPGTGEEFYTPNDFYGGTIKGITEKLDYLAGLGVGVIYLNPIFEADSNHRYNTSDYLKIDPVLGDEADFTELCEKADNLNIKVMLDGVFSHTGSDSVYFNKNGNYNNLGAYQGEKSPYYKWFDFYDFPDSYRSWWGFNSLPEVNEHEKTWQDFILSGEDNVLKHWLKRGAKGYRLDVADELPDEILKKIRDCVKKEDSESVVLGEVWEDATTKQSYGVNRKYALGDALDSVMNYPLRNSLLDFCIGKIDSYTLCSHLISQRLNYPLPMYYSLMNLLSSHDIERICSALATKINPHELTREQQATFYISDKQIEQGISLLKLCSALQYSLPGVPCIYYGDEVGMNGFLDPFNRQPYIIQNEDILEHYRKLGEIRSGAEAMSVGGVAFYPCNTDVIAILRFIQKNGDVFGNPAQDGCFLTVVNKSKNQEKSVIDLFKKNRIISDDERRILLGSGFKQAVCKLTGKKVAVQNGIISLTLAGTSVHIFELI